MEKVAKIEIVVGLILFVISCYFMLKSTFIPRSDLHGYGLFTGIFGASVGAIAAFAGSMSLHAFKYHHFFQLLVPVYVGVAICVFSHGYA